MSKALSKSVVLWTVAGVSLLAALALSFLSYQTLRAYAASSRRLGADIGQLRTLQVRADRCDAARMAFEAVSNSVSSAPLGVLRERLPDCRADALKEDRAEQIPGWVLHRQSMTIGDVAVARVMPVIAAIESQRPPWRLTRFTVDGSPRGAGFGRVELHWEAPERADAKPAPGK